MTSIYLDHNASTPVHPAVAAVMRTLLEGAYGNPSSPNPEARAARAAINDARDKVAACSAARPKR